MNSGLLSDLFLFPFPHSRRLSLKHAHPKDAYPRPSIEISHPSQVISLFWSCRSGLNPPSARVDCSEEEEEVPLDEDVPLDEEEDVKLDDEEDVQHAHPEDACPKPSIESSPASQVTRFNFAPLFFSSTGRIGIIPSLRSCVLTIEL